MVRGLCFLILLLLHAAINFREASANAIQIVYCIGNHDSTGACWKAGSENEEKFGCVITSWPIVECQIVVSKEDKKERYECLALQNTGIVNQIALSCQSNTNNASDEEKDSLKQDIVKFTPKSESASTPNAADQAAVLERDEKMPNAFQPGIENTTFGVEQPRDFKDAF